MTKWHRWSGCFWNVISLAVMESPRKQSITNCSIGIEPQRESTWWLCDRCTFLEAFLFEDGLIKPVAVVERPSLRFCRIIVWSISNASSRPSPVTAQVGCRCHLHPSSLRPSNCSSLFSSRAEGKSCLLANTSTGIWSDFDPVLQIFISSSLASSSRSSLVESTTKMMASVQRV